MGSFVLHPEDRRIVTVSNSITKDEVNLGYNAM
jgi:hypothetical protein